MLRSRDRHAWAHREIVETPSGLGHTGRIHLLRIPRAIEAFTWLLEEMSSLENFLNNAIAIEDDRALCAAAYRPHPTLPSSVTLVRCRSIDASFVRLLLHNSKMWIPRVASLKVPCCRGLPVHASAAGSR